MPWSAQIHTKFHGYRVTQDLPRRAPAFGYGPLTLCGAIFHSLHLTFALPHWNPTTPVVNHRFGLFRFRSPLLTESFSLSFPLVTEMFHFTRFRDMNPMNSGSFDQALPRPGYPIRKSPDHSVFAAPRSLSQLITSFFAFWHQGIHYVLLVA